jgi:TPR repeat protein
LDVVLDWPLPRVEHYLVTPLEGGGFLTRNPALALAWFRNAADQGDADAQYHVGLLLTDGELIDHDPAAAADWHRKAAEQGHAAAMGRLGFLYAKGQGVAADREQALFWLRKGAAQDDEFAGKQLAELENPPGFFGRWFGK